MPADVDAIQAVCDADGHGHRHRRGRRLRHRQHLQGSTDRRRLAPGRVLLPSPQDPHHRRGRHDRHRRRGGRRPSAPSARARHGRRAPTDRHGGGTVRLEQYLELGFNYRMTDLQAAVGLVQLEPPRRGHRLSAARGRPATATPWAASTALSFPHDPAWGTTNHQSFWVELPDDFPMSRDELLQLLLDRGISARRGIMAAHLEPACADLGRAAAAGHRAAHGTVAHPPAVPPDDRRRSGRGDPGDRSTRPSTSRPPDAPLVTDRRSLVLVGAGGLGREALAALARAGDDSPVAVPRASSTTGADAWPARRSTASRCSVPSTA